MTYAGNATAAPADFIAPQPGVTTPESEPAKPTPSQPGVIPPDPRPPTPRQPGVTPPPKPPPPMEYVSPEDDEQGVAPSTDYLPERQVPEREYVAPLRPEKLHPPKPEPPVAPIVPKPEVVRFGDFSTAAPEFLTSEQIDQVNAIGAGPEAQISQFARSVGVAPSRADSVASAAVAGMATGAIGGCAWGLVPFPLHVLTLGTTGVLFCGVNAVIGGVAGGLIGAGVGGMR